MAEQRTLVLFFPFNLLSHYLRCLVLADGYNKATHKVMFLSSHHYNVFVDQHGYETFDAETFDANYVMQCTNTFSFEWLNVSAIEKIMLSQVKVIKDLKADVVVSDVAPSLRMAAEIAGVNHINLVNGYMTRYYSATRKIPEKHPAAELINQLPLKVADILTNFGEKLAFRKLQGPFNLLRKKYKLKSVKDYLEELEGGENLICDLPELFPQKMLPKHYHFVGPLTYQYQEPDVNWHLLLDLKKPVICVCMGSTGNWESLRFLNDAYYSRYTIITAGDKDRALNAPHIVSKDFINLKNVLKISSLMICHGGNGTIYTGIQNQVYMLCISSHFEQEYNIQALERMGYGASAANFTQNKWREEIWFHCAKFRIRQHA
jgi:UDP:flavonoid glycosyltransferase YjiC (YdhE family)